MSCYYAVAVTGGIGCGKSSVLEILKNASFEILDTDKIVKICEYLKIKIKNKNKIFVCGNGGSAAITDHFVTDFNEYLKRKSKRKYISRAISLSNSMSLITAISNDISYDKIFTEQIENFYDKGDCVIIFSCSGTSKNIIEICKYAKVF